MTFWRRVLAVALGIPLYVLFVLPRLLLRSSLAARRLRASTFHPLALPNLH